VRWIDFSEGDAKISRRRRKNVAGEGTGSVNVRRQGRISCSNAPGRRRQGYGVPREVAFHLYIRQAMRLPYNAITVVDCQIL